VIDLIGHLVKRRRLRRHAKDTLRAGKHILNMREDVLDRSDVRDVRAAMDRLCDVMKSPDFAKQAPPAIQALGDILIRVAPSRSAAVAREYVEVLVVAVSVAVGFKTYFFQPFKIPTGSMQPTLYGVHVDEGVKAPWLTLNAGKPVKIGPLDVNGFNERTVITGDRYVEVRAVCAGIVGRPVPDSDPTVTLLPIGNMVHRLPVGYSEVMRGDVILVRINSQVEKGAVLCKVTAVAGDHVLVNRMALNFRRPRRDDVIVFSTKGIEGLMQGTHYIKRLIGLPGEKIGVVPPHLMVNGSPVTGLRGIDNVTTNQGYQLPGWNDTAKLTTTNDTLPLGQHEYAGFGDNTSNSKDSRYWGSIPEVNLVGPAVFVYWPFSARWGTIH
jgi:signal peptidase I